MELSDLNLPLSINTTSSDPIEKLFDPALSCSVCYDVAVGYFSTAWIRDVAHGLAKFAQNGGRARWIISPDLSEADFQVLRQDKAGKLNEGMVSEIIERSFLELYEKLKQEPRESLGWMINDNIIEFRIAIPINKLTGIMHAKMGYFKDQSNNEVGFSGSYNLTHGAQTNWEKIDIYCDWKSKESATRIKGIQIEFDQMWNDVDPNIAIYTPSDKALEPYILAARSSSRPYQLKPITTSRFQIPPDYLNDGKMRPYQEEAINNWFQNNGRGIFNMATGSGKTATALAAATRLAVYSEKQDSQMSFIVVAPFKHLADQWIDEAKIFGFLPVRCFDSVDKWMPDAQSILRNLTAGEQKIAMFIAVNNTFSKIPFQQYMKQLPGGICLIADEMHNLGAPHYLKSLPQKANFRLGLSATPVRHGDEEGTRALEEYFGKEAICFGLEQAIKEGFLCEYYYHPIPVLLTDEEMEEYKEISAKIARIFMFNNDEGDGPSEPVKKLLIKRARLISGAVNKVHTLIKLLKERADSSYNLIYCGDSNDGNERHVEKVMRLVGTEVKMKTNKFTADEPLPKRRELLEQFGSGELQALIAIRCLDEGVDVPRTETAYILASSTNPRQYIQRRGRVLRRAKGKKTATIYDFIAIPDLNSIEQFDSQAFKVERRLVKRELDRVNEFAMTAINSGESLRQLREIRKKLNLLDS